MGRGTARLIALLLLLLAGVDLGFPSLCQAESEFSPTPRQVADSPSDDDAPEPAIPEKGPRDDCFCCCVHIRPQPVVHRIEAPAEASRMAAVRSTLDPDPRAGTLFHPPRQ